MPPPQLRGKPGEVGISANPLASGFNCQCGMCGISNEFPLQLPIFAKRSEDLPMGGTRPEHITIRQVRQCIQKSQGLCRCRRRLENCGVGDYAKKFLHHRFRHPKWLNPTCQSRQPIPIRLAAKETSSSVTSRADVRSRFKSGCTRRPRTVGSSTFRADNVVCGDKCARSASSTTTLSVTPRSVASSFAFRMIGSGRSTVVRTSYAYHEMHSESRSDA